MISKPVLFRLAKPASFSSLALVLAVPASTQQQQQVLPPTARYTIDAGTVSGMSAMAGGSGGASAAMAMMRGGPPTAIHELVLKLGSTLAPTGAPTAEHFMPAGARLGASVPLETPVRTPSTPGSQSGPYEAQMPKARLLIYWGCGAHAPAGQPVVIDFSKLAKGQVPPGLFAGAVNVPGEWEINADNSKTYGEWPNAKDRKTLTAESSLAGAHRVTSSYAPEINFTLGPDFMAPLAARSAEQGDGSVMLSWNSVPTATGYYAWLFSAKGDGRSQPTEMVWWASSSTQQFGGPLWSWLSPAAVKQLIGKGTVMPETQTTCQVPAEVKKAAGDYMMGNLYAYGPEANYAYPPRPSDPKIAWKPDWVARARFRASTMWMLGMEMPAMSNAGRGQDEDEADDAQSAQSPPAGGQPSSKPKCPSGIAGSIMRSRGLCQ